VLEPSFFGLRAKTKLNNVTWSPRETVNVSEIDFRRTRVLSSAVCENDDVKIALEDDHSCTMAIAKCGIASEKYGRVFLIGLVGARFESGVVLQTNISDLLTAGLLASDDKQAQKKIICGPIFDNENGLSRLYEMIVDLCQFEIALFLQTALETLPQPLAFFCNHGKDRTGLMSAFIQYLCGVDLNTILDGYCLSEYFLYPIRHIVDQEMVDAGMSPDIMSPTPRSVMEGTFKYINQKYGSLFAYLNDCGFPYEKQEALRNKLVVWE
jgi:hypothetical protein